MAASTPTRQNRRESSGRSLGLFAVGMGVAGVATYGWLSQRKGGRTAGARDGDWPRPSWGKLLAEGPAAGRLIASLFGPAPVREPGIGRGRGVLVLPGFLANDIATSLLRRTLTACGFRAYGWANGMNLGARSNLYETLEARLDEVVRETGGPVALVGWSLGGLYAREVAKRRPADVSVVVTLGTPFSVSLRANNAWKLYEAINDHPVDEPPVPFNPGEKPPMRTVAIWSAEDGIVAPASARGTSTEADERVEVGCRHNELVSNTGALEAVIEVLKDWDGRD